MPIVEVLKTIAGEPYVRYAIKCRQCDHVWFPKIKRWDPVWYEKGEKHLDCNKCSIRNTLNKEEIASLYENYLTYSE